MGKLDQYAKQIFTDETGDITDDSATFFVPPEIGLHEVRADALLTIHQFDGLASLPAPWSLACEDEIVVELKMQGDKLDRKRFDRALLRRQAREVERREAEPVWQAEMPLWFIAPHLPRWLAKVRSLTLMAPGIWEVGPYPFQCLWIASNRLPLEPALIPFLLSRKDNRLLEFTLWVIDHREAEWLSHMIEVLPMTPTQIQEVLKHLPNIDDDPERLKRRELIAKTLYKLYPEWFEGAAEKVAMEKTLQNLYEMRLGRALSEDERETLTIRFEALGDKRLGQRVLELSSDELAAWLADPKAK